MNCYTHITIQNKLLHYFNLGVCCTCVHDYKYKLLNDIYVKMVRKISFELCD